jgi:hypothetical protein
MARILDEEIRVSFREPVEHVASRLARHRREIAALSAVAG